MSWSSSSESRAIAIRRTTSPCRTPRLAVSSSETSSSLIPAASFLSRRTGHPTTSRSRGYETVGRGRKVDSEYVLEAFQLLQGRARVDLAWDTDLAGVAIEWDGPKLGAPILTRPPMGQGRFRRAVDEAYSYRCAVTGSRTYPSLEAAHIRDFALDGGSHAVSNALLLRSDVHALYDRGYLGIDADLRLRVRPELRANGWNGVEFYEREAAGFRIAVPDAPHLRPSRDALDWHFRTRFCAS